MAQHYVLIQKLLAHQNSLESKAARQPVNSEAYELAMAEWGRFQADLNLLQQRVPWLAAHFKNGCLNDPSPSDPTMKGPADPFAAFAIGGLTRGQTMAEIEIDYAT